MVSISTFSTAALLEACVRIGRLTQPECEAAIEALIRGNVGDFAPNLRHARRFVAERGDTRGAMLGAMAKPAFWSDSPAAMEVYAALLTDLQMSDRLVVPDLVYVSVLGICRTGLPETRTIVVISGVLAHALITVGGGFGDVPTVLSAARSAIANGGRPLADVLPHAATEVLRTYEKSIFSNARRSTAPGAGSTLPGGGQGHDSSRHLGAALMSSGDVGVHVTVSALPPVAQHARTWWATGCRRGRRVDRTRVRKTVTVVNKVGGVRLSSPPALSATPFRPRRRRGHTAGAHRAGLRRRNR